MNVTMKWGALVWRMCWLDKARIRQAHTQVIGHVYLKERSQCQFKETCQLEVDVGSMYATK